MNKPKVYLILYERDLFGTWATPQEAVADHFRTEIARGEIDLNTKVEEMMEPGCDYPYILELQAGKRLAMDR